MILQNYGIDVALVDIMMPHMDGFDQIQKVRRTMDVPILVISAKVDLSDRIRGLDLGADDYILKPFEPLEVVAKVKARLRRLNAGQNCKTDGMVSSGGLCLNTGECCLIKNGADRFDDAGSITFGIFLIAISVVVRYGAEREQGRK